MVNGGVGALAESLNFDLFILLGFHLVSTTVHTSMYGDSDDLDAERIEFITNLHMR